MPNTVPHSVYYPDNNTQVDDLAGLFAAQANSVKAALSQLESDLAPVPVSDTGWTLAGITVAGGWSGVADANGNASNLKGGMRKIGSLVELRFRVTRSGAALTANAQGNIGDTLVCTINNTAYRPAGNIYSTFDLGPGRGTGGCRIEADGTVNVVDAYPTAKINSGDQIQITAMYFTG
jgi:hypothetical protein